MTAAANDKIARRTIGWPSVTNGTMLLSYLIGKFAAQMRHVCLFWSGKSTRS